MRDLRLSDVGKARLFRNAQSREQAGLLPITDVEHDPLRAPALRGAELRAFWDRVWERETNTLENTLAERSLAAWRLTRQLAIMRGVIQPDDPLEMIEHECVLDSTEFTSFREVRDGWLRRLLGSGVSMVPPDVPADRLLPNGDVSEDYDPERDDALVRFTELAVYFGQGCLKLDQSDRTRRGFAWFLDPATIRAGWPSVPVLYRFEADMVSKAIDVLVDHGAQPARDEIAARWGLPPGEVEQVCALAKTGMAMRQRFQDRDGNKALALAKLERLEEKALDALDHRGAAMIRREWWRIFDSKAEQDVVDEFEDMTNIITVSASEKRKALPRPKETDR